MRPSVPYERVLGRSDMPGADWFPGARLNYAQNVLRFERPDATALFFFNERTPLTVHELGGTGRRGAYPGDPAAPPRRGAR